MIDLNKIHTMYVSSDHNLRMLKKELIMEIYDRFDQNTSAREFWP